MTENPKTSRSKVMRGSIGVGAGVLAIFVLAVCAMSIAVKTDQGWITTS